MSEPLSERLRTVGLAAEYTNMPTITEAADLIDALVEACRGAHDTMHRLTAILPGNDVATDQVAVSMALIRAVLARAKGEPK